MRRHLVGAAFAALLSCAGDDDGDAAGDYCAALAETKTVSDEVDPILDDEDTPPEQLEAAFTELEASFGPLEDNAPEEISTDVAVIASSIRPLMGALADVDYDLSRPSDDPTRAEIAAALEGPEFLYVAERVNADGGQRCGITLGD